MATEYDKKRNLCDIGLEKTGTGGQVVFIGPDHYMEESKLSGCGLCYGRQAPFLPFPFVCFSFIHLIDSIRITF